MDEVPQAVTNVFIMGALVGFSAPMGFSAYMMRDQELPLRGYLFAPVAAMAGEMLFAIPYLIFESVKEDLFKEKSYKFADTLMILQIVTIFLIESLFLFTTYRRT